MITAMIAAVGSAATGTYSGSEFLWLTDIHYDKFYDGALGPTCFCNSVNYNLSEVEQCRESIVNGFGKEHCDSSLSLVESVITAAAKVSPNPSFILITGDYTRHNTDDFANSFNTTGSPTDIVQDAIAVVTTLISSTFNIPPEKIVHLPSEQFEFDIDQPKVIGSLGNNDYPLNYGGVASTNGSEANPYFKLTQATYQTSMEEGRATAGLTNAHNDTDSIFEMGGYTITPVSPQLSVINLNTIPYSPKYTSSSADSEAFAADPFNQFQWLENTLKAAEAEGVSTYITGHIPPSMDTYSKTMQWREAYVCRYEDIVRRYNTVVKAQLFGHLHKDEWRVHAHADAAATPTKGAEAGEKEGEKEGKKALPMPPMLLSGAVTPGYANNPSFRTVQFGAGGELLNWRVFSVELAAADTSAKGAAASAASIFTGQADPTAASPSSIELEYALEYDALSEYGLTEGASITNAELNKVTQEMWANDGLWKRFYANRQARWPGLQPCMGRCRVEILCALQSFSEKAYASCVKARSLPSDAAAASKTQGRRNLRGVPLSLSDAD